MVSTATHLTLVADRSVRSVRGTLFALNTTNMSLSIFLSIMRAQNVVALWINCAQITI